MSAPTEHLVDEFEAAFQNCFALLTSQEYFNGSYDSEEAKAGVDQAVHTFLDAARATEAFFLQKRLYLSMHRPEQVVKEDIQDLRMELAKKEALIESHYEKLQQWQSLLRTEHSSSSSQASTTETSSSTTSSGSAHIQQVPPAQTQQQLHQSHQQHASSIATHTVSHSAPLSHSQHSIGHGISQELSMPQVMSQQHPHAYPQGPLAYLEQTTSNIGMSEKW